ncbi:hypothetical protein HNP46_006371 [Pseudomonas nitritireducens]|uniref:Uncharacterized protein n=1 Tax=Pseudomonas nitroreducens TaxID=46680 RepID=A0A7W7P3X4_PSENT|nr:hypothetical protein [Pseudomonas nitritireducens]MBB4867458.1 hypothetical protein [Pseudomonas nitritireducens]
MINNSTQGITIVLGFLMFSGIWADETKTEGITKDDLCSKAELISHDLYSIAYSAKTDRVVLETTKAGIMSVDRNTECNTAINYIPKIDKKIASLQATPPPQATEIKPGKFHWNWLPSQDLEKELQKQQKLYDNRIQ